MTGARRLYAGLHLLDRQLLDRHAAPAGKVDDVELTWDAERNQLVVTALLSGSGALWRRLGAARLGAWVERMAVARHRAAAAPDGDGGGDGGGDSDAGDRARGRLPVALVSEIGPALRLAVDAADLATATGERWVRRHVVAHIPGSGHAPE